MPQISQKAHKPFGKGNKSMMVMKNANLSPPFLRKPPSLAVVDTQHAGDITTSQLPLPFLLLLLLLLHFLIKEGGVIPVRDILRICPIIN